MGFLTETDFFEKININYTYPELRLLSHEFNYYIDILEEDLDKLFNTSNKLLLDYEFDNKNEKINNLLLFFAKKITTIDSCIYEKKNLELNDQSTLYYSKDEIKSRINKSVAVLIKYINSLYLESYHDIKILEKNKSRISKLKE